MTLPVPSLSVTLTPSPRRPGNGGKGPRMVEGRTCWRCKAKYTGLTNAKFCSAECRRKRGAAKAAVLTAARYRDLRRAGLCVQCRAPAPVLARCEACAARLRDRRVAP